MFAEVRLRSGSNYSTITVLRNVSGLTFDTKYADIGAISFVLPLSDTQALGVGVNSMIEVCPNGLSGLPNTYYTIDNMQSSQTSDGAYLSTLSGKSLINWLTDAIVYPSTWPSVPTVNPDGTVATVIQGHSFQDASPGLIMRTLVARAVERGGLAWLDVSTFSGPTDSSGAVWHATLTNTYSNGSTLLQVLQDLSTRNLIEYQMVGNSLRLYNYGTMPVHKTPEQVTFRRNKNITEQTRTVDASDTSSVVLIVGDGAALTESSAANNATAQAAIGRRRERFVSQGGITDHLTLQFLADAELSIAGHVQKEDTLGISDLDSILPWVDYNIGDWVWADFDGTLQNIQVQQLAASQQESGDLTIGVTLGDLIKDADQKMQSRINNITGGDSAGGYGALPNQNDFKGPNAPTNVLATPDANRDANGIDHADVTITWDGVTANSDGSPLMDLSHYEVHYQIGSAVGGTTWTSAANVPPATHPSVIIANMPAGQPFFSQVRAVDSGGNASPWAGQQNSIEALPIYLQTLPTPSAPSVLPIFHGLTVSWDGLDSDGLPYDDGLDFSGYSQVNVYVGTTSTFIPGPDTLIAAMTTLGGTITLGGLDYTKIYYVKLIVVDKSKNYSPASDPSTPTQPAQINAGDITNLPDGTQVFTQSTTPTTANDGDLWIKTSAGNAIYVYSSALASWQLYQFGSGAISTGTIDATKIVAQGLTASVIASGTISAATINMVTNAGGTPSSINIGNPGYDGVQLSSAAGLTAWAGGTQTLSVSPSGNVTITGNIQTGINGQRVVIYNDGVLRFYAPGAVSPVVIDGSLSDSLNTNTFLQIRTYSNHVNVIVAPDDPQFYGMSRKFQVNFGGNDGSSGRVDFSPGVFSFYPTIGNAVQNPWIAIHGTNDASNSSAKLWFGVSGSLVGSIDYYEAGSQHFRFTNDSDSFIPVYASAFTVSSSEKLKAEISDFKLDPMEIIKTTPVLSFKRKIKPRPGQVGTLSEEQFGFVVEKSHKAIQHGPEHDPEEMGVDLVRVNAVLWAAVQKLNVRLEALEKDK